VTRGAGALYAINEQTAGTVSALDPDTLAVRSTVATGSGPAHVVVHPGGGFLFTSLYGGGATVTHPIAADGTVRPAAGTRRQGGTRPSHAHEVVVDPAGRFVLSVDLGVDTVFVYTLSTAGTLATFSTTPFQAGSGPRHMVFHPSRPFAYVANELSSEVTACTWVDGVLKVVRAVPASDPVTGVENAPSEIAISPDGRFVYVGNRGPDTIGVFTVAGDGTLSRAGMPSCGGNWPRHLTLDPTGTRLYVANERSGEVVWMPIDPATGLPGPVAGRLSVPGASRVLLA
jgi:6-phosphogluconolactonase